MIAFHVLVFAVAALGTAGYLKGQGWIRHIAYDEIFVFANLVFIFGEAACITMVLGRLAFLIPSLRGWLFRNCE